MRRLIIVALAAAAVTAATAPVGSAGQSTTARGLGCDWTAGAGTFSTVAHLGRGAADRARDAILYSTSDADDKAADNAKTGGGPVTIPVYVHILIGAGNEGNLTNAEIADQITVLNLAYSGFYGGVATPFRYRLDGIDRTVNPAWFAMEPGSPEELASDPIHDYMDYSDDPCYSEFTAGQTKRMEQRFRHYRA